MKISHRYKFVFFCNPKTGSESVRELLTPYSDFSSTVFRQRSPQNPFYSHMRPIEAKPIFERFGWDFEEYRGFLFVRNPWARLVSLYEMIRQNAGLPRSKADFERWLFSTKPFGAGGGGEDWKRWRKYGTYSLDNYACDENQALLVDKVIRLEDIETELKPYLKQLGIPKAESLKIPLINQRKKEKHFSHYYDENSENYVKERYAFDIANFNYSLERP